MTEIRNQKAEQQVIHSYMFSSLGVVAFSFREAVSV